MHRLTFCAMPCACHNSRYFVQISQTNSLNYCSMFLSNSNNGRLLKERPHEIDLCFCCLPDLSVQKHMTWHRRIHFMFRPAGLLWTHNRGNQAKRIVPIVFFLSASHQHLLLYVVMVRRHICARKLGNEGLFLISQERQTDAHTDSNKCKQSRHTLRSEMIRIPFDFRHYSEDYVERINTEARA